MDPVEKIAAAVMYEGYVLWPYRRSAPKNRQRWTFGALFPRAFSEAAGTGDPCQMRTECLVSGAEPRVLVRLRFLQVVDRRVERRTARGEWEAVDELRLGEETYLAWEEATEREVRLPELPLSELRDAAAVSVSVPAGRSEELLAGGQARLVRTWEAVDGWLEARTEQVAPGLHRLSVQVFNHTAWEGADRQATLRRALVSTHAILTVRAGEFISLTDPGEAVKTAAAACRNEHTWPVLVGEPGERHTLLSAPIILPDYPQIAPESLGDMFDGTEIDQLLLLNVLTLTDDEKREMRASDPRTREILQRAESLTLEDFRRLHGAIRDFRVLRPAEPDPFPGPFGALDRPGPESISVAGVQVRRGSRVRLRPGSRRDLMDGLLEGQVAVVDAVEQDYEERVHLAVVLEDDPGRHLGEARMMGHRFFFAPDEVEPLEEGA